MTLTVGSLFAGVGGFDAGLEWAGWETRWQVEIDDQARQVLRRHFPKAKRHTDVRTVGSANLARVDLVCGGFPCQDLSVAGRRAGLAGERSGLFFEFIRIACEVAPRWILVENVPGLLSSNDGRDFGVVLRELTGFWPQTPPDTGWRDSGVCEGPRGRAVWRVLDTQYFGPPQRRRRVFVVVDTRGECGPEILLEPEGLPWNPPPSREAGEGVTGATGRRTPYPCLRGGNQYNNSDPMMESKMLVAGQCHGSNVGEMGALRRGNGNGNAGAYNGNLFVNQVANSINARDAKGPLPSRQIGNVVLPFGTTQITSKANQSRPKPGDPCHPLAKGAHPPSVAHTLTAPRSKHLLKDGKRQDGGRTDRVPRTLTPDAVPRRLTPTECERLQGFPDDWTAHGMDEDGQVVEMADTPRYRMMGNAVSVPVAAWIGLRIRRTHEMIDETREAA